jgi:hypothetical protein
LAFRLAYYGEWVPNTALVKITPSSYHLRTGMAYASDGLLALAPFSFLALGGILAALTRPERQERALLLFMMTAFWLVYVIAIGGDVFPAFRHLIPIVVICTYGLIEGIGLVLVRLREKPAAWTAATCALLVALLVPYAALQFRHPENRRALEERWEWDGIAMGEVLKKAFSDSKPLLAVTAAGCLPYASELPCLDMMGLNDYYIPRHKPPGIGRGIVGHELGDGAYVLRRQPDIVCFHTGTRNARFRSGEEMAATAEFEALYTPVRIQIAEPREHEGTIWVRKSSDKIGIRKTSGTLVIPGYLLNANPDTAAFLDQGRLAVALTADRPAGIQLNGIERSDWQIDLKGRNTGRIAARMEHEGTTLSLTLTTDAQTPALVHEVVLRSPDESPDS